MKPLESTQGQNNLPRYFTQAFALLSELQTGNLEISLPDGRVFSITADNPGPHGRVDIVNADLFARMVREGDMGFSDAYLDGWWTTPDLQAVMDVVLANNEAVGYNFPGSGLFRAYERMRHWLKDNSKRQAKKNISYHYDLGNDFYRLWLDETMTYSSALFESGQEDLAKAQTQKYSALCDAIGVKPGDQLLEVGCGWGGFAEYAARERGAHVTGLTLSKEQYEFATKRMRKAGLADKVDIVIRDYRDETGTYDGIASIEMFEAVGEKYWPGYFEMLRDRLKPGGNAALQIITIADQLFPYYRKSVDFIQKHIFPGGMLPSPTILQRQIQEAGLTNLGSREFAESYSLTLRRWHESFNEKWHEIEKLGFDQRFKNMWDFYLTSCAASFRYGLTDVTQVTIKNSG